MKILIIKLSSIGDVVHVLPALYALRNTYPSAKIDWLVEEEPSNILLGHPLLNEVFIVKKRGWLKNFRATYSIAKKLRALNYDIILDFQGLFKSGLWVFLSKGKRRIGFDKSRELSYLFLNERLPAYNPDKHAVDRYLDIAEYLKANCSKPPHLNRRVSYPVASPHTKDFGVGARKKEVTLCQESMAFPTRCGGKVEFPIAISENEKKKVYGLLKVNGIWEGTPFVVVNQMARWETKQWEVKKFADLCNEVINKFPCRVVLVGASSEKENKEVVALTDNRAVDLSGKTTLKELAYLMSLSQMMITVDSGPMHIAAAMGVPVIALFGPTAPWRTGPYGEIHTVVRKELSCSPCFSDICKERNNLCMKEIQVRDVLMAVEAQVHKPKSRSCGI